MAKNYFSGRVGRWVAGLIGLGLVRAWVELGSKVKYYVICCIMLLATPAFCLPTLEK